MQINRPLADLTSSCYTPWRMEYKILVVDDERLIVDSLRYGLRKEGYSVITAGDGEQALSLVQTDGPDLVLLDIQLPKKDGWTVIRAIRQISHVPIIMLTARGEETDKVIGLELGADDYLVKPFSMRELIARVRAALRRSTEYTGLSEQQITIGQVSLDPGAHLVTCCGKRLDLTHKEFELLRALMAESGKAIARNDLIDRVWETDWVGDTRTLDVHIRWLREKIELDPSHPKYIQTIRGVGYRFATSEEVR